MSHRFKVGQNLIFSPGPQEREARSGTIEVVRLLPADGGEFQYRTRNTTSGQERVVRESQLRAA